MLTHIKLNRAEAQDAAIFPKENISTTDDHTSTGWLTKFNKPDRLFASKDLVNTVPGIYRARNL